MVPHRRGTIDTFHPTEMQRSGPPGGSGTSRFNDQGPPGVDSVSLVGGVLGVLRRGPGSPNVAQFIA